MVFTLQRYIFRELFRIFLMATIGLTLILSLGGVLQPVQEYGVGPRQVLHILLYFMPITLTFVLPMAALFASALTYGRFAGDNELNACRASGISLTTLVYPGLVLAILVAIANLLLSFHVMPYFVHLAEKSLKADAKQILFRNLERRGYYSMPPDNRQMVHADYVDAKDDTLYGIVAVEAKQGIVQKIRTADAARIQFNPHEKFNEVRLDAAGVMQMGGTDDYWWSVGAAEGWRYEFGSLLGDKIKFKRINEMKQIRANLMLFDPIARLALAAYTQLATQLLAEDMTEKLVTEGKDFYELRGKNDSIRFSAAAVALEGTDKITLTLPVVVEELDNQTGQTLRRLVCEEGDRAYLTLQKNVMNPHLTIWLHNPTVEETGQLILQCSFPDLMLPPSVRQSLGSGDVLDIVSPERTSSVLGGGANPILTSYQEALKKEIDDALVDIRAEMNSRLIFGIGCIPMILIGIGLGIIQKGGHLLSAFGASCVPAATLIVAIISGRNVASSVGLESLSGILIMWGGLAGLVLLTLLIYGKLMRT